jgi:hypothetical protein
VKLEDEELPEEEDDSDAELEQPDVDHFETEHHADNGDDEDLAQKDSDAESGDNNE